MGTNCFTNPEGTIGVKTEHIIASAAVRSAEAQERMAAAMEENNQLQRRALGQEHTQDGLNHVELTQKGSRIYLSVHAHTPEASDAIFQQLLGLLRAEEQAEQEGGPADA